MTTTIISNEEIRAQVLKVLSGYCFRERKSDYPTLSIVSPWISDVQLTLDKSVLDLDPVWFGLDYGIETINLTYSLLLLRLQFDAQINIITLPPNEQNYPHNSFFHRNVLEFLDEIGCCIFVNQELHSKLILSNDFALLGSFNLSKAALYDREEIGISLDDISNLKILEKYVFDLLDASSPFGFSYLPPGEPFLSRPKLTRGIIYEEIVKAYFNVLNPDLHAFDEFLKDDLMKNRLYYLDDIINEIAPNLDIFYEKSFLNYLESSQRTEKEKLEWLKFYLRYEGEFNIRDVIQFINSRLARSFVPRIPLKMVHAMSQEEKAKLTQYSLGALKEN